MGSGADLAAQLQRERLLDMEARLRPYRARAFAVLAVSLIWSTPSIGWVWIAPLAIAVGGFALANRMMRLSADPQGWSAVGWAVSGAAIGASILLTGDVESPAVAWLALPAVTLGARFEGRGVVAGVVYLLAIMALTTVVVDPHAFFADERATGAAATLVVAMAILSGAANASDREHRREAVLDPLTGLLNRAALLTRFEELEQLAAGGDHASVGLIVGDLDHFKAINDEHGHPAGDAVLADVAYALRKELRAFDHVYRVGGEEFVVVLPGADAAGAGELAERLRRAVSQQRSDGIAVTISLGVAVARGAGVRFAPLYAAADAALYEAKRAGRDRVRVAGEPALSAA